MATLFEYFQAIREGDVDKVKTHISSGKWPLDFQNALGHTALHVATIYNRPQVVALLAVEGCKLDLLDGAGQAPLHVACRNAHYSPAHAALVKLLLLCGANPQVASIAPKGSLAENPDYKAGRLPGDIVQEKAKAEVAGWLKSVKKDPDVLQKLKTQTLETVVPEFQPKAEEVAPIDVSMQIDRPMSCARVISDLPSNMPLDLKVLPKDVLLFVGQGTQFVGMARDIIEGKGPGRALFDKASAILGYDLAELCLKGPADKLNSTMYSQPAVMVSALAALEELKMKNPQLLKQVGHVAGFSLGEITALVGAGLISFDDGLRVVKARAESMQTAAERCPGGMGSITGLADDALHAVVEEAKKETGGVLAVANYLFPKGRVVSGDDAAVEACCKKALARGAMAAKKLVVGGAFHTAHMGYAKEEVAKVLSKVTIKPLNRALYSNVTGKPYQSVEELTKLLVDQVVSPVQWEITCKALAATGGKIYEVGAGEQLKAMMRRIDMDAWKRMENVGHWMPPKA